MARQFTRWPTRKSPETQDSLQVLALTLHRISNLGLSPSSGKAAQFWMRKHIILYNIQSNDTIILDIIT